MDDGILWNTPGDGMGKGKSGEVEVTELRGRCRVVFKNAANGVLVLNTFRSKPEHHFQKDNVGGTPALSCILRESLPGPEPCPE